MESRLLSLFALFLLSGILYSCTKEDDDKISNNGERHLEFKINVSDFRESIGGSQTEQEAAVKSLFLFYSMPTEKKCCKKAVNTRLTEMLFLLLFLKMS